MSVVLENFDYPTLEVQWAVKRPLIESSLVLALDGQNVALLIKRPGVESAKSAPAVQGESTPDEQERATYSLSARLEARDNRLQIGGSVSRARAPLGTNNVDVEPAKGEYRDLYRAIGVFAVNVASAVNALEKLQTPSERKVRIGVGCFVANGDPEVTLRYSAQLPIVLATYLADGKRFVGGDSVPTFESCEHVSSVEQNVGESADALITGRVKKVDDVVLIQPVLRTKEGSASLYLPELRVASDSLDNRRLIYYAKEMASYLDAILGKIDVAELGTFSGLSAPELISTAKNALGSKESEERTYGAALLEIAIRKAPSAPEPHFLLGKLKYSERSDVQAIDLLETALKLGWDPAQLTSMLKQLYFRHGLYDKARDLCGRISAGKDAGARNRCVGDTYLAEKRFDEALVSYSNAVKEAPLAESFYSLGLTQEAKKNIGQAINYYREALAKDKDFRPARQRLATISYLMGVEAAGQKNYISAVAFFTESLNASPTATAYFDRALTYGEIGDRERDGQESYARAVQDFVKAKELLADMETILRIQPWLLPNLGELQVVIGKPAEARRTVAEVFPTLKPNTPLLYGTDVGLIKFVCTYVEFVATSVMGENTEVNEAVLRRSMNEIDPKKLGWSFTTMKKFLGSKYLEGARGEQLKEKKRRAARILRFIEDFERLRSPG